MNKFFAIFFTVFLFSNQALAQDGKLLVKSQYFSVYDTDDVDVYTLLSKLNFNYFLHLGGISDRGEGDLKGLLAKTLDSLFLEVSDSLDMHIYSYQGNIKFLANQTELDALVRSLFRRGFSERSLYIHEENTIYISSADLTLGMLAHEIAHAIISHYFVVPPPAKVQEILSGYVEYSLRKSTSTLP